MSKKRLISVIIINHNGREFLERCFSSVLKTNYDNFEVIFVDNASTDESLEYLKKNFLDKHISFFKNNINFGVPGGRNIGFKQAKGDFIVFLDNDTEVDSEWLNGLIYAFETDNKIAVAQSKLLSMVERDKFDHAGDYLTPFGLLVERSSHQKDTGQFDKIDDIFNAKGAATMIRSSVFKELGMYDETYFMYLEETDFCLRAWLAGYRVVFAPKSVVWHAFNTPLKEMKKYYSNYIVRYYGCRNYITTHLKNLNFVNLMKILPLHILGWFILSLTFLIKGKFFDFVWINKGIFWNLLNLPCIFKKRNFVQRKIRKVKD
ncbi:glycosyltransferase family 2 protein, partial [Candidatus Omnitrophota bacterium]